MAYLDDRDWKYAKGTLDAVQNRKINPSTSPFILFNITHGQYEGYWLVIAPATKEELSTPKHYDAAKLDLKALDARVTLFLPSKIISVTDAIETLKLLDVLEGSKLANRDHLMDVIEFLKAIDLAGVSLPKVGSHN